jgi:hypothetical protein
VDSFTEGQCGMCFTEQHVASRAVEERPWTA